MVLLGLCLFLPQKSFGQSTISCSSDDEGKHSCAADTRGGVRLLTQHSGSACTEGYSWGSDNQGIWVDHGCRADFSVGGNRDIRYENRYEQNGRSGQSPTITCNSDDERKHFCSVDTRGGVRLLTQHSDAICTEGSTWGSDGQGIWVDHGCRADFAIGGRRDYRDEIRLDANRNDSGENGNYRDENRNDQYGGSGQSQRIACNSDDMRKHSCALDARGGEVRMVSQRSDARCTKGYSWGTNRRGVWVDHGCRADFVVSTRHGHDTWR
jgi:Protein of unknown function (DUF3011)